VKLSSNLLKTSSLPGGQLRLPFVALTSKFMKDIASAHDHFLSSSIKYQEAIYSTLEKNQYHLRAADFHLYLNFKNGTAFKNQKKQNLPVRKRYVTKLEKVSY